MSVENLEKINERLCGLCDVNSSKYCCPRCNVFYCSLDCYKSQKHLLCSESFYKDCINQELSSHEVDDEAKKKMIDILKKMHDGQDPAQELEEEYGELDSDDGSELDLQARIQNLNLDDPDAVWDVLTEDEKNEFEALLQQGEVGSIVPHWEPWWMYYSEKKLVEEIQKENNEINNHLDKCPALKSVPKFDTLTSVKPSAAISYNISNILAAYAFVMRYFNGEIEPLEAITYLLDICCNLSSNTNFDDADVAVEAVAQKCLQSELIETDEESLDIMKNDTLMLLRGPTSGTNLFYSKSALSHLIQLFMDSKYQIKAQKLDKPENKKGVFKRKFPDHGNPQSSSIDKSKCTKIIKKLEFYLSFLNSCDIKPK